MEGVNEEKTYIVSHSLLKELVKHRESSEDIDFDIMKFMNANANVVNMSEKEVLNQLKSNNKKEEIDDITLLSNGINKMGIKENNSKAPIPPLPTPTSPPLNKSSQVLFIYMKEENIRFFY